MIFSSSYLAHQMHVISEYLKDVRTVLDFGCGDMALDRLLIARNPTLMMTGIDVVSFPILKQRGLTFRLYKGERLPFPDRSFDAVFSYHVFHHCPDPACSFKECVRVSKYRIIIVEPVLRYPLEKIGFQLMDYVTNIWKKEHISLPYNVQTRAFWEREFKKLNVKCTTLRNVGILPRFLPIGETLLFVLEKRV